MAAAVMMMIASAALGMARAQGTWSTAQLSEARYWLAAASVGNVVLFAGGWTGSALLSREGVVTLFNWSVDDCVRVECLLVLRCSGSVCLATA